jgi:Uma2 family endonuclease
MRSHPLGRIIVEALFLLDAATDLQRRPDIAFISYARWPKKQRLPRTNAAPVVPNLAIEVVSPTNGAEELLLKMEEYFLHKVEQVWIIYPDLRRIDVYESPTVMRILKATDELDGGRVLPGFRLPVAALFEEESQTEDAK